MRNRHWVKWVKLALVAFGLTLFSAPVLAGFWGDDEGDEMDWVLEKKDAARVTRPPTGPKGGRCDSAKFRCGKSAACKRYLGKIRFGCWHTAAQRRGILAKCRAAVQKLCTSLKPGKKRGVREVKARRGKCVQRLRRQCQKGLAVKMVKAVKKLSTARKQRRIRQIRKARKVQQAIARTKKKLRALQGQLKRLTTALGKDKATCSRKDARRGGICSYGKCFCASGFGG